MTVTDLAGALGLFVSFIILGVFLRATRSWFQETAYDKEFAKTRVRGKPRITREAVQDLHDAWSEMVDAIYERLGRPRNKQEAPNDGTTEGD